MKLREAIYGALAATAIGTASYLAGHHNAIDKKVITSVDIETLKAGTFSLPKVTVKHKDGTSDVWVRFSKTLYLPLNVVEYEARSQGKSVDQLLIDMNSPVKKGDEIYPLLIL